MTKHKFPYKWNLKDTVFTKDKGKVFSCFACGGGSTMGYKLAGFDVIGCNEIDPKMMKAYISNHRPQFSYCEPIQTFKLRNDLPKELYNLDILDGSPPCSSFSMAGNREKDWGKEKKFREGQAKQVLDNLFFDFIDLVKILQPKVVIAENVKGLLLAGAQKYVAEILKQFNDAGYYVDYKLLDASKMGVPQRRERVFFYAIRKDLYSGEFTDLFRTRPKLDLKFIEPGIKFKMFYQPGINDRVISQGKMKEYWLKRQQGDRSFADTIKREWQADRCFNNVFLYEDEVSPTLTSNGDCMYLFSEYRKPNFSEMCCIGTFPQDYTTSTPLNYLIGMSVPPVMTAQIATRVWEQWLT